MQIRDDNLLDEFRRATHCHWCKRALRHPAHPHHLLTRGMGGGGRMDVRENLVALGGPWDCGCHQAHHDGQRPLTCDLLALIAAREGCLQGDIEAYLWRLRRADKHTRRLFGRTPAPGYRFWSLAADGDDAGFRLARRHYSAAKNKRPKQRQFVGPGEKLVLLGLDDDALFVWRKFLDDSGQVGVNCALFRNESPGLSSAMILEAEQLAWAKWPGERLYTYVNAREVRSTNPGCCFKKAGWRVCGTTKKGLLVLEKRRADKSARPWQGKADPDGDGPDAAGPGGDGLPAPLPRPLPGDRLPGLAAGEGGWVVL